MTTTLKSTAFAKRNATETPGGSTRAASANDRIVQIAGYLLSIDDIFKRRLSLSALRPASRLLLFIAANRSVTIKEAMLDSTFSYRAFYVMLGELKKNALVSVEGDANDGRVRRLVLGAGFRKVAKILCELELS